LTIPDALAIPPGSRMPFWRGTAHRGEHGDLAGSLQRHNDDRLTHNKDDDARILGLPARLGWRQPARCLLRVVAICSRKLNCEGNATTIADQVTLTTQLSATSGIRARLGHQKPRALNNYRPQLAISQFDRSGRASRKNTSEASTVGQSCPATLGANWPKERSMEAFGERRCQRTKALAPG
jgi:hypothetical protein